jgi:O-antigen/teichoic acid export membrane protein
MISRYFYLGLDRIRLALAQGRGAYIASLATSQMAPLVSAPIVSRLYAPEDFGIYGIFYALVAVLAGISSLALHNAVILRNEGEPSFHAVVLSLATTAAFSICLFVIVFSVGDELVGIFFSPGLALIIEFLPLTVFLAGTSMCLTSWAIRSSRFDLLARNKVILALTTATLQIAIGFFGIGAIGFVFANILGIGLSILLLLIPFAKHSKTFGFKPSIAAAKAVFIERKMLVFWMVPANLISSISAFMPELLIGKFFGVALLGQFVLANRMLNFPIAFMSAGVQDIFRQQAVAEFDANGMCRRAFWRFLGILMAVSVLVLMPIIFAIPYIFPIIFGMQWSEAGTLIQSIAFLTIVRFISSPLSYIWIIQDRQRLDFFWQIGLFGVSLGALILPPLLVTEASLYSTLSVYSLVVGAWYLLAIAVSYHLSGQPRRHPATMTVD